MWYLVVKTNYLWSSSRAADQTTPAASLGEVDDDHEDELPPSTTINSVEIILKREIRTSANLVCVALVYILLTCPSPIIYAVKMMLHGDMFTLQLNNALVPTDDPQFRQHWKIIVQLMAWEYATEYILIPLRSSITVLILALVDRRFRSGFGSFVCCASPSRQNAAQQMETCIEGEICVNSHGGQQSLDQTMVASQMDLSIGVEQDEARHGNDVSIRQKMQ